MKGRAICYSSGELAWVKANGQLPAPQLHAGFCAEFGRYDISQVNLVALRKRMGLSTGRTGCFEKGLTPHNKGKTGICAPGSEKGWFVKGQRRGVAVSLYKPIGTERVTRGGYLQRKVHDGLPPQSRWKYIHLINWEAVNGTLPKGMALKCVDGDRSNVDATNWIAIPRALLPRLAGGNRRGQPILPYDEAPAALKPAVLAVARLDHAVRTRGAKS